MGAGDVAREEVGGCEEDDGVGEGAHCFAEGG